MKIASGLLEEIVRHALEEAPNECCGVVSVRPGAAPCAAAVHRAVNIAASPLRFEIDPRQVLELSNRIEDDGLTLGAIYHSHTRTAPYPSQTDISFAAHWPGVEWVIVGLGSAGQPAVRSYLIDGGRISEVPIAVQDGAVPGELP